MLGLAGAVFNPGKTLGEPSTRTSGCSVETRIRRHDGSWHDARVNADPIRILVVDDHPAIAMAIRAAAAAEAGAGIEREVTVVGAARTVDEAMSLLSDTSRGAPDVVLCDVQLQAGMDGLQVLDAAVGAGLRAIVLTSFDRSSLMRAAFEHGASGFLDKGADLAEILRAVRLVADGGAAFSMTSLNAARYGPRPPSEREVGVIRELQRGATNDEIGGALGITGRTVESHLRRLFDRYGVVSRTELAFLALREGWIEADRA
jgi:DNA-binding NarL/FixJ family response regulator